MIAYVSQNFLKRTKNLRTCTSYLTAFKLVYSSKSAVAYNFQKVDEQSGIILSPWGWKLRREWDFLGGIILQKMKN